MTPTRLTKRGSDLSHCSGPPCFACRKPLGPLTKRGVCERCRPRWQCKMCDHVGNDVFGRRCPVCVRNLRQIHAAHAGDGGPRPGVAERIALYERRAKAGRDLWTA